MAHDQNGRVGPPRCDECNAPLTSDDRSIDAHGSRFLCLDCDVVFNAFAEPTLLLHAGFSTPLGGNS